MIGNEVKSFSVTNPEIWTIPLERCHDSMSLISKKLLLSQNHETHPVSKMGTLRIWEWHHGQGIKDTRPLKKGDMICKHLLKVLLLQKDTMTNRYLA